MFEANALIYSVSKVPTNIQGFEFLDSCYESRLFPEYGSEVLGTMQIATYERSAKVYDSIELLHLCSMER